MGNGYLGVAFFFLLSGFILTYSYAGQMQSGGDRRRFWEARFARVYPVYLLSLLINWPYRGEMSWGTTLAVLGAVQAWNPWKSYLAQAWNFPAWTLSVEAFFYLCFPIVLPLCLRLGRRSRSIFAVVLLLIAVFIHSPVQIDQYAWWGLLSKLPIPVVRLPEFLIGMLTALRFMESPRESHRWLVAAYAASAVMLLSTVHGEWLSLIILPFSGLLYELAAVSMIPAGAAISRWSSSAWLMFLGGASYSIYLLQFPVRNWVRVAFAHSGISGNSVGALISPVLLILLSCVVFPWYEEPSRRMFKKWFAMRESRPTRGIT
jgi:peptidoglycan/LPS O-acetylase OafA/YrhL